MSVIDENKMKLLKMKERLLEVSSNNNMEIVLDDYKRIVYEIDNEFYKSITDKIESNSEYIDYPLERQLEILLDIGNDYNDYNEFQEKVKSICNKYNNSNIRLCDINVININDIRKRINNIKKYLENIKQIEKNKEELDNLNSELISEDKKANSFKKRINELDEDLRQGVLKAEGRVYNSSGGIEYANILLEAESLEIDLKMMLNDESMLKQTLDESFNELNEVDERLKTAQICYDSRPNINYKDIYLTIRDEAIHKKYRFIFLEIISLITKYDDSYEEAKEKRNKLTSLIKSRIELLKQININYLYDPFDRIGIKEQLGVISAYGDNSNRIKEIINRINEISSDNDVRVNENRDFVDYFKEKVELIKDNTPLANILDRESINLDQIHEVHSKKNVVGNQVIKNSDLPSNFMLDRSLEKAHGVINRVYEMINGKDNTVSNSSSVTPQLVIEPVVSSDSVTYNNKNIFSDSKEEKKEDDIFLDLPFEIDDTTEEDSAIMFPDKEKTIDSKNEGKSSDDIFLDLPFEIDDSVEDKGDTTENNELSFKDEVVPIDSSQSSMQLFQEVKPFEEVSLFDDRYDDGTVFKDNGLRIDLSKSQQDNLLFKNINDSNKEDNDTKVSDAMPDVFWTTASTDDGESLDEQSDAIIESETNPKVKRLVS